MNLEIQNIFPFCGANRQVRSASLHFITSLVLAIIISAATAAASYYLMGLSFDTSLLMGATGLLLTTLVSYVALRCFFGTIVQLPDAEETSTGKEKSNSESKSLSLHEAIKAYDPFKSNRDQIQGLLESGADVNEKGNYGKTPLMVAVETGNLGIVKLLLDKGAAIEERNALGQTALHLVCLPGRGSKTIVEELLKRGAGVDAEDDVSKTPLHYAVKNDHLDAVRLLIRYKAKKNATECILNQTPFHLAATALESMAMFQALWRDDETDVKVYLLACDKNGRTPIDLCHNDGTKKWLSSLIRP